MHVEACHVPRGHFQSIRAPRAQEFYSCFARVRSESYMQNQNANDSIGEQNSCLPYDRGSFPEIVHCKNMNIYEYVLLQFQQGI